MQSIEELNRQIDALMKKYKLTLYVMIACIAIYLVLLFWAKQIWLVLIVCIPMVLCAFYNSRLSKQIRALVAKRNELKAAQEKELHREESGETVEDLSVGDDNFNEAIVANAKSLNDLPKEYTVLDDVILNGAIVPHVILSPYGVAVVDDTDRTEDMNAILQELNLESPVYMYAPDEDVALLAEKIQMPKQVVLTEPEIYEVLYKVTGLK